MTTPSERERAEQVAADICNRCWHEITPDHPMSVREIADLVEATRQAARRDERERCADEFQAIANMAHRAWEDKPTIRQMFELIEHRALRALDKEG